MIPPAVMALSGGMDSTCLLLRLVKEGHHVTALGIDYGQRHRRELDLAQRNVSHLQALGHHVRFDLVDLRSAMATLDSSLTNHASVMPEGHYAEEQMKQTVVPNRNAIFSSLLFATALSLSKEHAGQARIAPWRPQWRSCHLSRLQARILCRHRTRVQGGELGRRARELRLALPSQGQSGHPCRWTGILRSPWPEFRRGLGQHPDLLCSRRSRTLAWNHRIGRRTHTSFP